MSTINIALTGHRPNKLGGYNINTPQYHTLPYRIGCGLAGGNWQIVKQMIENIFSDYPISIYKL